MSRCSTGDATISDTGREQRQGLRVDRVSRVGVRMQLSVYWGTPTATQLDTLLESSLLRYRDLPDGSRLELRAIGEDPRPVRCRVRRPPELRRPWGWEGVRDTPCQARSLVRIPTGRGRPPKVPCRGRDLGQALACVVPTGNLSGGAPQRRAGPTSAGCGRGLSCASCRAAQRPQEPVNALVGGPEVADSCTEAVALQGRVWAKGSARLDVEGATLRTDLPFRATKWGGCRASPSTFVMDGQALPAPSGTRCNAEGSVSAVEVQDMVWGIRGSVTSSC